MLGDERILPKSELAFQARQCASCGADIEATDVYCAECGAELPPMAVEPSASLPSAPATTEPPSEYVFAGLAALAPRDALRVLLASYPAMLRDRAMFLAAMERYIPKRQRERNLYRFSLLLRRDIDVLYGSGYRMIRLFREHPKPKLQQIRGNRQLLQLFRGMN